MNAIFLPSFTQPMGNNNFGPSTVLYLPAADGGCLHVVVLPALAAPSAAPAPAACPGSLLLHGLPPHARRQAFHVPAVLH